MTAFKPMSVRDYWKYFVPFMVGVGALGAFNSVRDVLREEEAARPKTEAVSPVPNANSAPVKRAEQADASMKANTGQFLRISRTRPVQKVQKKAQGYPSGGKKTSALVRNLF